MKINANTPPPTFGRNDNLSNNIIKVSLVFHLTGAQNVLAIAETDGYRQRTITLHIDMPNEDSYFFVLFPKCQENCGERILKTVLWFIIL